LRKLFYFFAILLILAGGLEFLIYRQIVKWTAPEQNDEKVEPKDLLLAANNLQFTSQDGTPLHGWLILGKAGYPALIVAHDYGSNRSHTLMALEGLITALNKQGYFIFLFDFRGHGSGSSRSALGYEESSDLDAALRAVLKYKQIARRLGVLGVGMGAVAASQSFRSVDEVKLVMLDSLYPTVPSRFADTLITEFPPLVFARPVLKKVLGWNMKQILRIKDDDVSMPDAMHSLYPKAVVFVEKKPVRKQIVALYEAAREPKELLQIEQTAGEDLIGAAREEYTKQVSDRVEKYLPAVSHEKTLELSH
jgi:alpha/beta superfamily hydrolase